MRNRLSRPVTGICVSIFSAAVAISNPFGGKTILSEDVAPVMKEMHRNSPVNGSPAPDFQVYRSSTGGAVNLSSLWKDRPAALFFSSSTCDHCDKYLSDLFTLHEKFGRDVQFAFIYIREAHPVDGWSKPFVETKKDPVTLDERIAAAARFAKNTGLPFPVFADAMDDRVAKAYAAWPLRHHLIDRDGRMAFCGAVGPWGYRPLISTPPEEVDLSEQFSYVPRRNQRTSMESILNHHLNVDLPEKDPFSGKPITSSKTVMDLIFHRLENIPPENFSAENIPLLDETGKTVKISKSWQQKPAVLVFGTPRDPLLYHAAQEIRELQSRFGEQFQFTFVCLRSAKPDTVYSDTTLLTEAKHSKNALEFTFPMLVDTEQDAAAVYFSAWPARLVVVDTAGKIIHRGYQGPWLFKPGKNSPLPNPKFNEARLPRPENIQSLEEFLIQYPKVP